MVRTIISDRMSVIVQCISSILIATIVSLIADWRMALVAWAAMPCHFIGGQIQAKSAKGFSAYTPEIQNFSGKTQEKEQERKYGVIQGFSLCLWNIAHAVALWYKAILIERNQATFINGIKACQIFSPTVPSITELWTLIPTVISAISVLAPEFGILDWKTEIEPDAPERSDLERVKGRTEFENVKFNYPLRPEVTVLNNFG
ncbi:ABC transporter B family protein [Melia azedarach]|uniref:ABC transporter B family protein n=1 Tax=Melia azedarach TaxID=155640 RepID=A0ACC1YGS4_MELAZ|nr:ABC transporter B family protein [Melia azedarach]